MHELSQNTEWKQMCLEFDLKHCVPRIHFKRWISHTLQSSSPLPLWHEFVIRVIWLAAGLHCRVSCPIKMKIPKSPFISRSSDHRIPFSNWTSHSWCLGVVARWSKKKECLTSQKLAGWLTVISNYLTTSHVLFCATFLNSFLLQHVVFKRTSQSTKYILLLLLLFVCSLHASLYFCLCILGYNMQVLGELSRKAKPWQEHGASSSVFSHPPVILLLSACISFSCLWALS